MTIHQVLATLNLIPRRSGRRKSRFSQLPVLECLERRELLAANVSVLKNIGAGNTSGVSTSTSAGTVAEYDGWVYFTADDGTHGFELWRTDGNEANTQLFMDVRTGVAASFPADMYVANGKLFFSAANNAGQRSLYLTDGTVAGTTLLTNSDVGQAIGVIGTTVYYYRSGVMNNEGSFWKTDGTPAGTVNFANAFVDGAFGGSVVFDDTVFLSASEDRVLWKIDTATDTLVQIANSPFQVGNFEVAGNTLYFGASINTTADTRLWKLDSAAAVPTEVQTGTSGIATRPINLTNVDGTLYFSAFTSAEGIELWRSDGTSAGTMLVKNINAGSASSEPQFLTAVGTTLFLSADDGFRADDGDHGRELWRSDGTTAGTVMVKDLFPGLSNSDPTALFDLNGLLLFTARRSLAPPVLWTSDGDEAATTVVNSTVVSDARNFAQLGNIAIFAASNSTVGREMFIFQFGNAPPTPVITGPTTVSSSLRPTVTWNAVGTSTEYEIWIRNTSTRENPMILEHVSGTSYTPSIDLGIGNFTAWVRTLGTIGAPPSAWSFAFNFRIKAPVTQLPVTTDPANGFAMLSWQALPGAVNYDVWIDRLDVPTTQIYRNTNVSGTNITPTSLPNGGRYRVWVRGIAARGAVGAWSASQDFVETQVPAITGGLNPTFDTSPTISWTAVPDASSYEVYVRSINGNFRALLQKNIATTTFTWPELPAGPYEYWVRVTGATVWSVPVIINTDGRTNVLSPTGSTTNLRPEISWRPVDLAVRYELWVDQLGVDEQIIYQTNLTSSSYTPPSNLPLGNYRIWVRAVGSTTTAPWSPSVDFTIADASTPETPGADFDLLASVFSDSLLLPVPGMTQPLVIPSSMPNAAPEEPRTIPIVSSTNGTSQFVDTESPHEHTKA